MNKIRSVKTKSPLDEKPLRRPGQSLDEKIGTLKGKLLLWIILIGLVVGFIILEWAYYFIKTPMQPTIATILAVLFVLVTCPQ